MRYGFTLVAGLAVLLLIGLVPVLSQEGADGEEGEERPDEAWMRLHQPGPEHEWLAQFAGEFTIAAKFWMEGADEPMEMDGEATIQMHWGRYLQENIRIGDMEGVGLIGFDNSAQEFKSVVVGVWSTGMNVMSGVRDEDGKTITQTNERVEKAMGNTRVVERVVTTHESADSFKVELYAQYGDAPERKTMEFTYTRKE
jgi:hypothetical protein